jgi:outer membrane protein assembly factor BamA
MWKIKLLIIILLVQLCTYSQKTNLEKEWEAFPIINYDTDVGFGYGAKGFFYNYLNHGESFDLTAYNSTKGERWYRFVYSLPDLQRRQGTEYDFALDFILDYDKWINYKYYIEGKDEELNEEYIREPIEISTTISRAFSTDFVAEFGLQYKSSSCYRFDPLGKLKDLAPSKVQHISLLFNFRVDTRTNFINPQNGILIQLKNQYAKDVINEKQSFYRIGLTFQSYIPMILSELIYASRIQLQWQTNTSYQNKLSIGGNSSLRGLPQDRYLSNSFILLNQELRFPIFWRFNGIVGADIGNGKSTKGWIINPVLGLRFNMNNFIVRADLGFGKESIGFYFNFGHLF